MVHNWIYVVSIASIAFFASAKFLHDNEDTALCNTTLYKLINASDVCRKWDNVKQGQGDLLIRHIICGITISSVLNNAGKIVNTFSQNIEISRSAYAVPLAVTTISLISHIMQHTGFNYSTFIIISIY